jgi:hypothetical protein
MRSFTYFSSPHYLYRFVTSSPVFVSKTWIISILSAEALPSVVQGSLILAPLGILIFASKGLFG